MQGKKISIMNRLDKNGKLYIVCAAIWFDDGKEYVHQPFNIKSGFVICGHRHHNCFATAYLLNGEEKIKWLKEEQGFITSGNEFVNRVEAVYIAFRAGQIDEFSSRLYSEDIY